MVRISADLNSDQKGLIIKTHDDLGRSVKATQSRLVEIGLEMSYGTIGRVYEMSRLFPESPYSNDFSRRKPPNYTANQAGTILDAYEKYGGDQFKASAATRFSADGINSLWARYGLESKRKEKRPDAFAAFVGKKQMSKF